MSCQRAQMCRGIDTPRQPADHRHTDRREIGRDAVRQDDLVRQQVHLCGGERGGAAEEWQRLGIDGEEQARKLIAITETGFKFESGELAFGDVSEVRFTASSTTPASAYATAKSRARFFPSDALSM